MHLKYKIAFWLWVVFTMCLIGVGFSATKAHAEEHFAQIHCEATDLDFYKSEHGAMFATVKGELGNFMYIPAENQRVMFFMNIDTGKMLELVQTHKIVITSWFTSRLNTLRHTNLSLQAVVSKLRGINEADTTHKLSNRWCKLLAGRKYQPSSLASID